MKLNKWIHENLMETAASIETCWAEEPAKAVTEDDIEEWITDWYMDTFTEGGLGKESSAKPRAPPLWLAGPRWYDRRDKKIKQAKEAEMKKAKERSYDKDGV